jgi:hypothetical protein
MRILDATGNPVTPGAEEVREHERLFERLKDLNRIFVGMLPPEALEEVGGELGVLSGETVVLPHEEALDLFFDCCVHDWLDEEGRGLAAEFVQVATKGKPVPERDRPLLDALRRPRMSLFRLDEQWRGAGVRLWDAVGDAPVALLDSSLGRGPDPAGAWMIARILKPRSWSMTTGAPVILGRAAGHDVEKLIGTLRVLRRTCRSEHEMAMHLAAFALKVIEGRSGPDDAVEIPLYKADEPTAPLRATRPPGRNEPCPCGSGKKYKKCCALAPRSGP